jgi:FHS family Na+ dependent glucose MFS transporter 1
MAVSGAVTAGSLDDQPGRMSQTAVYCAVLVALGLTVGSLGPTLTALAQQTHVALSAISYLFTARSLGYVLGAVSGGKLFDRRPGNPVMAAMLVAMAGMMTLVPLAPHLWLLLIVMFILGAAEATIDVGANTLLVWVHRDRVAPFMNAMHCFFGVGALIAPIVVAQAVSFNYPSTDSYFVLALLLLPVAALLLRLPSPAGGPTGKRKGTAETNLRLVFLISLFLFLYLGAEVGFAGWIFTYAVELKLGSLKTAAYLTSLFWGGLTAGRMLMIPLAARIRSRSLLIWSLGGCLLSMGLMLWKSYSLAAIIIGTIGLGFSMASIFPATLSLAGQRMQLSGQMTGSFIFGSSVGAMLIPLVIGQLFESAGARVLMFVVAVTLLAAVGVLTAVIRSSEARTNDTSLAPL